VFVAAVALFVGATVGARPIRADCVPGNQVDKPAFFADLARHLRNPRLLIMAAFLWRRIRLKITDRQRLIFGSRKAHVFISADLGHRKVNLTFG
jgi:hypothetical protein